MMRRRSRPLLLCTAAIWIALLIGTGYAATINISLHMEPPDLFPLCPGVHRIELHCVHTRESHNPGWRIRGEGLPMYGYARLGQGLLQNHEIIKDTDTVEVLQIDPVMSSFTYYCLYVVLGEEVITEPITLNVIDLYKAVMGLQVTIVSGSEATVHWSHTDVCGMAARYEVVVLDFTGDPVFNKSTTMLMMTLDDLQVNGKYEVIVSVIGRDGVRGEPNRVVFRAGNGTVAPTTSGTPPSSTANQGQNVTAHFSTLCEVSQLSCSLYTLAAVLVVFAGIVILVLVVALFWRGKKKLRSYSVSSSKHPAPVYQEPRPVPLQTAPQSYLYDDIEWNVMSVTNQLSSEDSTAEAGTFV